MKPGYRSGKLVTLEKVQKSCKNPYKSAKWLCRCDCGNEKVTLETSLYNQMVKSCGCHDYKNKNIFGMENYEELIKDKISKNVYIDSNDCWLWTASKHKQGYGNLNFRKIPSLAHRVSWTVYKGEIPCGMNVCHKCDNPSCCNPEHLFLGTQLDNVVDCKNKNRFTRNIPKTRRTKLNYDQVKEIKKMFSEGISRKKIQEKFDVGQTCVAKILTGKSWQQDWTKEL